MDLHSCSCAGVLSTLDEAHGADAVFIGTVVSDFQLPGEFVETDQVEFDTIQIFKGAADGDERFRLANDRSSCGVFFRVGESFLIYAFKFQNVLRTHLCTRTRHLEHAASDLEILEAEFLPGVLDVPAQPELKIERGVDNLKLILSGAAFRPMLIESSSDLMNWNRVDHVIVAEDEVRVSNLIPGLTPQNYFRARESSEGARQGIFGVITATPGVCFPDDELGCKDIKFLMSGELDVRRFQDTPDLGRHTRRLTTVNSTTGEGSLDIPESLAERIKGQDLSSGVKQWMQENGMSLSPRAVIHISGADSLWLIVDPATTNVYAMEDNGEKFTISRKVGFRVPLPAGDYCLWDTLNSCLRAKVELGDWSFVEVGLALP